MHRRLFHRAAAVALTLGTLAGAGLAPAQAFEPENFLADLDEFEVKWSVEPLP